MRRFAALTIVAVLAACATPADKIETALVDYGLPAKQSRCMGERLEARLDYAQLQRLAELVRANRGQGKVSVNALADQLNEKGDPKLVAAVVRAGLSCLF